MKTTVDWLKFRTRSGPWDILEAVRPAFGSVADLLTLSDQSRGVDHFEFRRDLLIAGDVKVASIDYGGEHQRGWHRLDMSGTGCSWVQDWSVMAGLVHVLVEPEIRRLDLALTTYAGEVSHATVIDAYKGREFSTGGRPPGCRIVESLDELKGRTIYIGNRASAKFARCYEKGLQLLEQHVPAQFQRRGVALALDGVGYSDPFKVYRCEVEYKARDGYVIPWPAMVDRDAYFAGAYPFFESLLPGVSPRRSQLFPEFESRAALATSLEHCRRSYGKIIKAALMAFGGDTDKVLRLITADRPAEALIAAGVLLIDHE
jgi:phage replication initiation protein